MQDFDLIGLDLDGDAGKRTLARGVATMLGVVFFILSAATTAMFFMTYAPGLGDLAGSVAGPYVAALVGVLSLDLASLAWSYVRAHGTDSQGQQVLAGAVGALDLVMSLIVSALYVLLGASNLDAGVVDQAGNLTALGQSLHLAGVVIVTLALVVNFASVWLFSTLAASTRAAAQRSELAAAQREAQFKVANMHTRATVQRSVAAIAEQLPAVTTATANHAAQRYVEAYRQPGAAAPAASGQPVAHVNGNGSRPT